MTNHRPRCLDCFALLDSPHYPTCPTTGNLYVHQNDTTTPDTTP